MYSIQMPGTPELLIDLNDSTPVNRQIVEHIRTLLVEGALQPGDALPSVRRLAIDLGVHFNTIADAYHTLADEGWLDIAHGRRITVKKRRRPSADEATENLFRQRLRQLVAEMRAAGLSEQWISRELTSAAKGVRS